MAGGRSPQEVFHAFCARRKGILRALTTDADTFFTQCDPTRENLCLYGNCDGSWTVDLPAEEVPPEMPEPALGINFARDGMQRRDWLSLVAVHSDSWLLGLAFYQAARLNREQRAELFSLINSVPTCYEVVAGKVKQEKGQPARPARPRPQQEDEDNDEEEEDDEDDEEDEAPAAGGGWRDGEGDPCPGCERLYRTAEFWIACDRCDTWWCGRCAKMTQAKAEKTRSWKCVTCAPA